MLAPVQLDEMLAALDPIEREAYDWIVRFASGAMTSAETEAMKAWYGRSTVHAEAYARARRVWNALGPVASARAGVAATKQNGVGAVDRRMPLAAPVGRRALLGTAVAAAATAATYVVVKPPFDLWPAYAELMADYRTGAGEQRQVAFDDAVSLDLNTKTSIAVRTPTADAPELEILAGEAAISAHATSGPLTVIAASGRVKATRSNFNLRCDGSYVVVTCLDGSLLVEHGAIEIPLGARQQVAYDGSGIGVVTAIDPVAVTAWRHGILNFEATPVAEVISEVNRYRASPIVLMNADIGRRLLTARLKTAETGRIITQIVNIFGARARTLPGGIVLLT
ncbi:FecR domain-containing protein [Microbacteriaceae bacterium K1510]|nr:FecR domain-containing protein [Microbacteriaceae bacterium K1510]